MSRRVRPLKAAALALVAAGLASAAGAGTVSLDQAIELAPPGTANEHAFAHLAVLDPANTYVGGAIIDEDTCIQGNGATLDLQQESILVVYGAAATRLDVDHCLIVNGGALGYGEMGGGIEYGPETQGRVVQNTFYNNSPTGLYLHEVVPAADAVIVTLNIFYRNALAGLVRNQAQPGLTIRYNDSNGCATEYGMHCACPSEPFVEIFPGQPPEEPELDASNFSDDPGFVKNPNPPKEPGDFHLSASSPCIGVGPFGEDLGAFPFVPTAAEPVTWGALKSRFRP